MKRASRKLFVDTYGAAPEGVWAAPGRVNLIGEHTDYNAGLCLPIALPHRTFIALKPREDTKVRVVSGVAPDKVAEADLDGLKARGVDGWSAYPTGVAWALRQAGFDKVKGFDAPPPAVLTRTLPCVAPKATRCCLTAVRS